MTTKRDPISCYLHQPQGDQQFAALWPQTALGLQSPPDSDALCRHWDGGALIDEVLSLVCEKFVVYLVDDWLWNESLGLSDFQTFFKKHQS